MFSVCVVVVVWFGWLCVVFCWFFVFCSCLFLFFAFNQRFSYLLTKQSYIFNQRFSYLLTKQSYIFKKNQKHIDRFSHFKLTLYGEVEREPESQTHDRVVSVRRRRKYIE